MSAEFREVREVDKCTIEHIFTITEMLSIQFVIKYASASVTVCACVRACLRACVRACVRVPTVLYKS